MEVFPFVPPLSLPLFSSFNLLVKLTVAICEVCQKSVQMCVYIVCMLTLLKDTF